MSQGKGREATHAEGNLRLKYEGCEFDLINNEHVSVVKPGVEIFVGG
jgi:hypothetical protein